MECLSVEKVVMGGDDGLSVSWVVVAWSVVVVRWSVEETKWFSKIRT